MLGVTGKTDLNLRRAGAVFFFADQTFLAVIRLHAVFGSQELGEEFGFVHDGPGAIDCRLESEAYAKVWELRRVFEFAMKGGREPFVPLKHSVTRCISRWIVLVFITRLRSYFLSSSPFSPHYAWPLTSYLPLIAQLQNGAFKTMKSALSFVSTLKHQSIV